MSKAIESKLKPCPFCGGNASISGRELKYLGVNAMGIKKIKVSSYVTCNRCHARGPCVTSIVYKGMFGGYDEQKEKENVAVEAWNRRTGNE